MSAFSIGFNVYIMTCPFHPHCQYYDTKVPKKLKLLGMPVMNIKYFSNYQMLVFSAIAVSGTLSYFVMFIALICKRSYWCREQTSSNNRQTNQLSRLKESDDDGERPATTTTTKYDSLILFSTETVLNKKQLITFFTILATNILVVFTCGAIKACTAIREFNRNDSHSAKFILDCIYIESQYVTWFCGIVSCFIFSKLSHIISIAFTKDLYDCLKKVITTSVITDKIYNDLSYQFNLKITRRESDNDVPTHFEVLQDVDQVYVKYMKNSLKHFRWWFAIHWFFYTVTAFLAISYFIEIILRDVYRNKYRCHEDKVLCGLKIAYSLMICLSQCFLFIYPCLRAASITAARRKVIRQISQMHWKHISFDQRHSFLQYMELEDCAFKISIACANITFGFNLAYFSVFAGIMAVILKISL